MKQYIYGKNTILEALKGEKRVYTVYVQNNFKDNKIIELCKKTKVPYRQVDKSEFIKKVGNVTHQGIMAEVEGYRYYSLDEILDAIPEGKQPLLLMLDGLEDPHNLGAILRTCDAIGVDGVIIGKNHQEATGNDKTSLMFSVHHKSGALYDVLEIFKHGNINMTTLESRPSKQKPWEYLFYTDIDGHKDSPEIKKVLDEFIEKTPIAKVLGSYPKGEF